MQPRRVALVLFRLLSFSAAALGALPVHVWPLRPRPWPTVQAVVVAFLTFLVTTTSKARRLSSYDFYALLFLIWTTSLAGDRVTTVCRRRGLCCLIKGVLRYCERHPVSDKGWCGLLWVAAAATVHIVWIASIELWWWIVDPSLGEITDLRSWEGWLNLIAIAVRAAFSSWLLVIATCPTSVIGVLAADLRRDCRRALCSDDAENRAAERWRGLRVRLQLLHDAYLASNALLGWQLLVFVSSNALDATIYSLFVVREVQRASSLTVMAGLCTLSCCCSIFAFVVQALVDRWARAELCKLANELGRLPSNSLGSAGTSLGELDLFIYDLHHQDWRCNVLGLFYFDSGKTMKITAEMSKYFFVLFQFNVLSEM